MVRSRLLAAGFGLLLAGFLLPFLMVLRLLEPGLALSFVAYSSMLLGLILTLAGAILYPRSNREER
jgi:hypothetical protein